MRTHTRWTAVLGLAVLGACGEGVTEPRSGPTTQGVKCGEGICPIQSIAPAPPTVPDPATITGH